MKDQDLKVGLQFVHAKSSFSELFEIEALTGKSIKHTASTQTYSRKLFLRYISDGIYKVI